MDEKPADNGNTWLGLSAGTGAWGGMIYLVAGHFCPVCLVLTPVFFIGGLVKKLRSLKYREPAASDTLSQNLHNSRSNHVDNGLRTPL